MTNHDMIELLEESIIKNEKAIERAKVKIRKLEHSIEVAQDGIEKEKLKEE